MEPQIQQKDWSSKITIWFPIIIGVSLIIGVIIGSFAFYKIKTLDNVLSVTGSASQEVTSDQAKFSGSFSRIVTLSSLKSGYSQMATDLVTLKSFLKDQGIEESAVTVSPISMYEIYNNNNTNTQKEYTLSQNVEISSTDVQKITALAQATSALINGGVIFTTNPVQYYYSKLPELRVNLLSEAVKDAKARAGKLAESTGKTVGSLQSASSGVVQVLPKNSLEVSDYGTYDTSTIDKTIMITVRTSFNLN